NGLGGGRSVDARRGKSLAKPGTTSRTLGMLGCRGVRSLPRHRIPCPQILDPTRGQTMAEPFVNSGAIIPASPLCTSRGYEDRSLRQPFAILLHGAGRICSCALPCQST